MHKHLELLNQKTAIFQKVLDITQPIVLTGNPEKIEYEVQAFTNLYQRRENILADVEKIDAQIDALDIPEHLGAEYVISLAVVNDKQKKIVSELIKLDKVNIAVYEKLKEHIKGDLKNVRQTMDVNEAYFESFESPQGHFFDKKN